MLRPVTWTLAAALVVVALLSGCSGEDSSSPDAAESPSPSAASSSAAPASDAASQALCSALTNAVAATAWNLGEAQAGARQIGGMSVPSCEVAAAEGDPLARLTVAYLPSTDGLAGLDLLAALCQAVVGAKNPSADGRSCAVPTKPPAETGAELRRADLTTKDVGVLVLSFSSEEPSYRKTSVDDLASIGQALAVDPLLAMAVG